jgi:hypothetical protein
LKRFIESDSDAYILLSKVKDPSRFGVAVVENGKIVRLVEKPKELISDLAVVRVYFFRDPDLVEKAFKTLKPLIVRCHVVKLEVLGDGGLESTWHTTIETCMEMEV